MIRASRDKIFSFDLLSCKGISWVVFSIALCCYWATAGDSVAYWDCPEYVTVASLLEVGHPPGNPVWTLAMRVATMFFPPSLHAFVINLCSGLFMAFASMFLSRIIYVLTWKLWMSKIYFFKISESLFINPNFYSSISAFTGALCFALCGSAWYSAVEAEVYAMSAFLTSLCIWLMLQRAIEKDSGKKTRLLILVAYLTGLSLGVHELGLLCIPVYAFIWAYGKYRAINVKIWLSVLVISLVIIILILLGTMEFLLAGISWLEINAVNNWNFPYMGGVVSFIIFIFFLFLFLLFFIRKQRNVRIFLWSTLFIFIGFSSFSIILIRGNQHPPMNEGNPDSIFALSSYISREQYGKKPLFYGPTPYSMPLFEENLTPGNPIPSYSRYRIVKDKPQIQKLTENPRLYYRSGKLSSEDSILNSKALGALGDRYILSDYSYHRETTPELNMFFPRITSSKKGHIDAYADWAGMNESNMEEVQISETVDAEGKYVPKMNNNGERIPNTGKRPTYLQHLQYFFTYQIGYMYLRYLGWNFIGKQNDIPSTGEIEHGNVITGFPFLDNALYGDQNLMPGYVGIENPGRNVYFGLPFLIGIVGIIFLFTCRRRGKRVMWIVSLFFLMTGVAIVVYLNQDPGEPRERDYSFLGSYMAFAIWIGIGTGAIVLWVFNRLKNIYLNIITTLLLAGGLPLLLGWQNFDDNNRRNRFETYEFARYVLNSKIPSIILSVGDNFTFPLWYAQEVMKEGEQHTLVDLSYLNSPAYVVNLMMQGEKGLKLIAKPEDIMYGAYSFVTIPPDTSSQVPELKDMLLELYGTKEGEPRFNSARFRITSGSDRDTVTYKLRDFTFGSSIMNFRQLMILDILASNSVENTKRLYFLTPVARSLYKPFDPFMSAGLNGRIYNPGNISLSSEEQLTEELNANYFINGKDCSQGYIDPTTSDQIIRQRGALITAARNLMNFGNHKKALETINEIEIRYPYEKINEGSYSMSDSIFYEGIEYAKVLRDIYFETGDKEMLRKANRHLDYLIANREAWMEYYRSLSKSQRDKVSYSTMKILSKHSEVKKLKEEIDKLTVNNISEE